MDIHPTGDTSRNDHSDGRSDGRDLIHRARKLRQDSRRIGERAAAARRCFDPPTGRHTAVLCEARLIAGTHDQYVLVQVQGAIDMLSHYQFAEVLTRAVDSGAAAVIVDLSAVTLLSAAGLRCLEQATERLADRGGCLHVVCPEDSPPERILRLFDPYRSQPRHTNVPAAIQVCLGP